MPSLSLPEPPLEAHGIVLRAWREEDIHEVEEAVEDPEIRRRNRLPSPFDARAWLDAMPGERERGEAVRLLIGDAGRKELLGAISLRGFDWGARTAELGYWIVAARRGVGVGGQAVSLLSGWALSDLGLAQVLAITDADNVASRRMLERCGFRIEEARPAEDGVSDEIRYVLDAAG